MQFVLNEVQKMDCKKLVTISLVFILFRLIFAFVSIGNFHSVEDFRIATNLANGNGYSLVPALGATALKVPIYPLILSAFIKLFGANSKLFIVLFQHIIIGFVPLLIYKLADYFANKTHFKIAALLFLLHPSYFYYPNVIEVTNIFIPLSLIWTINFFKLKENFKQHNNALLVVNGILSGIMVLTQPISIPILLSFYSYLFLKNHKKKSFDLNLISIFKIVMPFILILSPWIIRNYVEFNRFIPTKSPFWMNFYEGYSVENLGTEKYDKIPEIDKARIDSLREIKNDVEMEFYYKEIVDNVISENPSIYFDKCLYQAKLFWIGVPRYSNNDNSTGKISSPQLTINKTFLYAMVRKIPNYLLNIALVTSIILISYRFMKYKTLYARMNFYMMLNIVFVLGYFTVVYSFTMAANTRFKLDIEWVELLVVANLFLSRYPRAYVAP